MVKRYEVEYKDYYGISRIEVEDGQFVDYKDYKSLRVRLAEMERQRDIYKRASARLAEVEAQRDGLKNALNFYAEDDADSVECGILESVYHRPATEALAKLEVSDGMENKADRR